MNNEKPTLRFYLSPTFEMRSTMGVGTMMEGMLMSAFRRGWIETSTIKHGQRSLRKIMRDICCAPSSEADRSLHFAANVSNYMAEQGFLAASSKFNNETHPWNELIDIAKIPELMKKYASQKEYIFGVKDWEDVHFVISDAARREDNMNIKQQLFRRNIPAGYYTYSINGQAVKAAMLLPRMSENELHRYMAERLNINGDCKVTNIEYPEGNELGCIAIETNGKPEN
jgi:hypothetical protein